MPRPIMPNTPYPDPLGKVSNYKNTVDKKPRLAASDGMKALLDKLVKRPGKVRDFFIKLALRLCGGDDYYILQPKIDTGKVGDLEKLRIYGLDFSRALILDLKKDKDLKTLNSIYTRAMWKKYVVAKEYFIDSEKQIYFIQYVCQGAPLHEAMGDIDISSSEFRKIMAKYSREVPNV